MKCNVTNSKAVQCNRDALGTVGLCAGHRTRYARWGNVQADRPLRPYTPAASVAAPKFLEGATAEQRFFSQVNKTADHWLWTGGLLNSGYGQVSLWGTPQTTNRAAWQLAFGEIPEGVHIVPTCRVKLCVRLSHLEARFPDGTPYFEFSPLELAQLAGV